MMKVLRGRKLTAEAGRDLFKFHSLQVLQCGLILMIILGLIFLFL